LPLHRCTDDAALIYPIVLGLDRIEAASFLRANGTLQHLTGLPSFPDPQTLRRFSFHAPERFWGKLRRINNRLLQTVVHLPDHRSRLIFDLDSTVVTVFGHQDGAEVGYNPRYRGKRSYKIVVFTPDPGDTKPSSNAGSSLMPAKLMSAPVCFEPTSKNVLYQGTTLSRAEKEQ
jgi:hypothetical protein